MFFNQMRNVLFLHPLIEYAIGLNNDYWSAFAEPLAACGDDLNFVLKASLADFLLEFFFDFE